MLLDSHESGETSVLKPEEYGYVHIPGSPKPPPMAKPPFTLKEIRDSIPPHCFNSSLLTSFSYLTVNLLTCLSLFYAATYIKYTPVYISIFLWPAYWFMQGVHIYGLWVIGHECGHQAFSDYPVINDTVGFILHSLVLVPYYGWKVSHRRHHMNTSSFENDEAPIAFSRSQRKQDRLAELLGILPYTSMQMVFLLLFAWPMYLFLNHKGPEQYIGENVSHFSPTAAFFSPKEYNYVVLSDAGVLLTLGGLIFMGTNYGIGNVISYYVVPYLIMNCFIIFLIFLSHTDTFVPRYRSKEWSWLRGQFSTVDRSYGKFLGFVFHHITDTHVVHHLFPSIPFYHAEEATRAITKVVGKYYLRDDTPVWTAFRRLYTNCKFAEDDVSIIFHKKN